MKQLKILFICLLSIAIGGCSSNKSSDSSTTKYSYNELTFMISNNFDVSEETYGLVVNGNGWKATLSIVNLSTSTDTMNSWQGYLNIARSIYPNIINTTYIDQEAIQYTDSSVGLCIETYLKNPKNPKMIRVALFDENDDHEKLLENKDIKSILDSCEVK